MEYMDGNLYQLMKARDHKPLDGSSVKSVLFQILSGLEHIHEHNFFHRDIKPENILVSTSASDTGNTFKRYSALVTPPSTPPTYSIKIADFGLAREQHSKVPYTTYVSTRWYRAPEVLLRAGEYSAPVDIWAIGAMAVEIATLKPLFPGGNEVDQVWRVCEIMGSPGSWINKQGQKVGGGEWKDGIKLAQKLGFSFPKMAPHSLETVLPAPHWPASLAQFVTWCLMWDPKCRPTSRQALEHEYFADALDPLRPKSSSTMRMLSRKSGAQTPTNDPNESTHSLSTKTSSWFRKSLPARDVAPPPVPEHIQSTQSSAARPMPVHANTTEQPPQVKGRPANTKRATWTNGPSSNAAPIPILPSIRPVSPLQNEVNAQANTKLSEQTEEKHKKIGRQLSMHSQGNHYADIHRQEAERILNGSGLKSPTGSQKESFFSHIRKRARRLSGRHQGPLSPNPDDVEANAGCAPWAANRQSIPETQTIAPSAADPSTDPNFAELDRALQSVRYSIDAAVQGNNNLPQQQLPPKQPTKSASNPALKRHHSLPYYNDGAAASPHVGSAPISARTRRSVRRANHSNRYETPDEEDELLDEALTSAHKAARRLDGQSSNIAGTYQPNRPQIHQITSDPGYQAAYLTPSPSKDMNGVSFGAHDYTPSKPVNIPPRVPPKNVNPQWPTPPYDENDWAAAAAASIFATQEAYR